MKLSEELEKIERAAQEPKPTVLPHINLIEDPALAGKPVIVEAVVSSTSVSYLVPKEVEATVEGKDGDSQETNVTFDAKDPINIKFVGVNEDVKYRRLKRLFGDPGKVRIREKAWRIIYMVRVRPPVFTLEKKEEKIVDERGFEYKSFDIFIASDKPIDFRPSCLIRVEGIPTANPKTQQATLLVYKVEFPEEAVAYDQNVIEKLRIKFQGLTVEERLKWILGNFEKYSQIVGRSNLAEAGLLAFFTPTWVKFNGEVQRGWGNVLFYGDTTTAKTETIRKLIRLLGAGMLVTAETASTVGLTGTATQVEKQGWFVDWGFLVLLDRKLLAVDGAHKLSLSNWAALAEAERSGVVSVAKAAKNSAYARTRQIKIANPVDREADKYTTKSLSGFLYACHAIPTILDRTSIARLDLAVFADQRDVKPEDINRAPCEDYDPDLLVLGEVLKWCWSQLAEVVFADEAVEEIHEQATSLYNVFFCEEIPLASIDMKWKLARLSSALAFLTLSTEDYSAVTVTKEHVEAVVNFIKEEYSRAGLNTVAQATRHEALDAEDVKRLLMNIEAAVAERIDRETICKILRYIVLQGRITRDEIMAKFSLSRDREVVPLLSNLKSEGLIKIGRGFYPEPKLIQAYKVTGGFLLT